MLGVDVVGVLVGYQHRVDVFEVVPGGREAARVDQQPGVATFDQEAGMAQSFDSHGKRVCQRRRLSRW